MKVKCYNCGLVCEAVMGEGACPECGFHKWYALPEEKIKEKVDKESLEMIEDLIRMRDIAKKWVENWENLKEQEDLMRDPFKAQREAIEKQMDTLDPFHYRVKRKEEGLAFEIYNVIDGIKLNIRKIYFDGRIEGFQGDPCIINHAYPKFIRFKAVIVDMLRQINEDYMKLAERHIMADMPITTELDCLKKAYLERINNIKI